MGRKDEVLRRLDDKRLLELARDASDGEVISGARRDVLIKLIKSSLSIEEINHKISGAQDHPHTKSIAGRSAVRMPRLEHARLEGKGSAGAADSMAIGALTVFFMFLPFLTIRINFGSPLLRLFSDSINISMSGFDAITGTLTSTVLSIPVSQSFPVVLLIPLGAALGVILGVIGVKVTYRGRRNPASSSIHALGSLVIFSGILVVAGGVIGALQLAVFSPQLNAALAPELATMASGTTMAVYPDIGVFGPIVLGWIMVGAGISMRREWTRSRRIDASRSHASGPMQAIADPARTDTGKAANPHFFRF